MSAIKLDGYVSAATVEDRFSAASSPLHDATTAHVDLFHAVHFDIPGLLRVLSATVDRHAAGKETQFRLPRDVMARHMLRLWQFPTAASMAAETPFRLLVDRSDWEHFGENWPRPHSSGDSPEATVLTYLVERRSFGLMPYRQGTRQDINRILQDQAAHWSGYALSSLLSIVLRGPVIDLARVVVQEMLAGVVLNSTPSIAIVGSHLSLSGEPWFQTPPGLTISIWHNGSTVGDRFMTCIQELASSESGMLPRHDSDVDPGIWALCRTAVETFSGSVEVRTTTSSTTIAQDRAQNLTIQSTDRLTSMSGDLITVRLPVKDV